MMTRRPGARYGDQEQEQFAFAMEKLLCLYDQRVCHRGSPKVFEPGEIEYAHPTEPTFRPPSGFTTLTRGTRNALEVWSGTRQHW
jgi:hypothetical protein